MRRLLAKWILNSLALWIVSEILKGVEISNLTTLLIATAFFGLINATIGLFIKIITLPMQILTLGLLTFVINGFLLYIVSALVSGFVISGFGTAILAAFLLSIVSSLLTFIFKGI